MKVASLTLLLLFISKIIFAQPDTTGIEQLPLMGCIEIPPKYPGGLKAMKKLMADNMQYPKAAEKQGPGSRMVVTYMVDTFGYTTNIKVYKSGGKDFDEEAVRLIRLLKNWKPATLNDKKIAYYQSQPFVFIPNGNKLQRKGKSKNSR